MAVTLNFRTTTAARDSLQHELRSKIVLNSELSRQLVSYQADKETAFYRWFKYREGFTSQLVRYLLDKVHPEPGMLLDPFAGSGSALFTAVSLGWQACGIELLPVGANVMEARIAASRIDPDMFAGVVEELLTVEFAQFYSDKYSLRHIPITRGAFPEDTERDLVGYIAYCDTRIEDQDIRKLALFAAFCILEDISYTRKDGQYLRWDHRSNRSQGSRPFNKGKILTFYEAIRSKLGQMVHDITGKSSYTLGGQLAFDFGHTVNGSQHLQSGKPQVLQGSCLEILPTIPNDSIDVVLTSPPYANRYDYTRTYALELVFLGCAHEDVVRLRQAMLSCTVENKTKHHYMRNLYEKLGRIEDFNRIATIFDTQEALQEVLGILDELRERQELNNGNIANMVRNYFYEMCFVIHEMARVLSPGGHVIMVNDNVRYAGEEVPVDIILSSMAEKFGLNTDRIWTLPRGKGNSSQQMGIHGRTELRKCVYIWKKPG